MHKNLLAFLFSIYFLPALAQFSNLWTYTYNAQVSGLESAYKMLTDEDGNIYTAGNGTNALFLSKHDKNGNLIWRKTDLFDDLYLRGFERDTSGNFFIFGERILKCDSLGNFIDSSDFSFISNFSQCVSVISGENFFYLTASTKVGSDYRIYTCKLDYNLNIIWQNTYNSSFSDSPVRILLDANENVFIAGVTTSNIYDMLVLKYSSSGLFKWAQTYNNNQFNDIDFSRDACIDSAGSIILTGQSYVANNNKVSLSVKFDSTGLFQWDYFLSDTTCYSINNEGMLVLLDEIGNYYILGNATCKGVTISKLNSTGDTIWIRDRAFEAGWVYDAAIDYDGNLIMDCRGWQDNYIAVMAYDSSGNYLWEKTVAGDIASGDDRRSSILINVDSNIVACGRIKNNSTSRDAIIVNLKDSIINWVDIYDGTGNLQDRYTSAVFIDTNEIFGIGKSDYGYYPNFLDSIIMVRLDTNGNQIWSKNSVDTLGDILSVFSDNNRKIYFFTWHNFNYDSLDLIKVNDQGNKVWCVTLPEITTYYFDNNNSIYFAHRYDSSGLFGLYTSKVDTLGNITYYNSLNSFKSPHGAGCTKILSNGSELFYIGLFIDSITYDYIPFVQKTDLIGNIIWTDTLHKNYSVYYPSDAILQGNNLYLLNSFYSNWIGYNDSLEIMKYDSNGSKSRVGYYSSDLNVDYTQTINIDALGNYYIIGYYQPNQYYNLRIKKINPSGVELWSIEYLTNWTGSSSIKSKIDSYGNVNIALGSAVILSVSPYGNIFSNFQTDILAGNNTFESIDDHNGKFLVCGITNLINGYGEAAIGFYDFTSINTTSILEFNKTINESITIFPNPTNSSFRIVFDSLKEGSLNIYDMSNKLVYSGTISSNYVEVDAKLSSGMYLVTFVSESDLLTSKLVITE